MKKTIKLRSSTLGMIVAFIYFCILPTTVELNNACEKVVDGVEVAKKRSSDVVRNIKRKFSKEDKASEPKLEKIMVEETITDEPMEE